MADSTPAIKSRQEKQKASPVKKEQATSSSSSPSKAKGTTSPKGKSNPKAKGKGKAASSASSPLPSSSSSASGAGKKAQAKNTSPTAPSSNAQKNAQKQQQKRKELPWAKRLQQKNKQEKSQNARSASASASSAKDDDGDSSMSVSMSTNEQAQAQGADESSVSVSVSAPGSGSVAGSSTSAEKGLSKGQRRRQRLQARKAEAEASASASANTSAAASRAGSESATTASGSNANAQASGGGSSSGSGNGSGAAAGPSSSTAGAGAGGFAENLDFLAFDDDAFGGGGKKGQGKEGKPESNARKAGKGKAQNATVVSPSKANANATGKGKGKGKADEAAQTKGQSAAPAVAGDENGKGKGKAKASDDGPQAQAPSKSEPQQQQPQPQQKSKKTSAPAVAAGTGAAAGGEEAGGFGDADFISFDFGGEPPSDALQNKPHQQAQKHEPTTMGGGKPNSKKNKKRRLDAAEEAAAAASASAASGSAASGRREPSSRPREGGAGERHVSDARTGQKRMRDDLDDSEDDEDEDDGSDMDEGSSSGQGQSKDSAPRPKKGSGKRSGESTPTGRSRGASPVPGGPSASAAAAATNGRAVNRGTPWTDTVDWAGSRHAAQALHREIVAFDRYIAPTDAEHEMRRMVVELIRRAIVKRWRDAQVLSFGSQETKLYLPQGDLDLVALSPAMEHENTTKVLHTIAFTLRSHGIASEIQVIAKARVPIVKFTTLPALGSLKVDVSLNRFNGVAAADFVNQWLERQPAIRPLVICVKCLLQQRGLSEVFSGGLGSFSIILLVISFLQLHPKVQRREIDPCENLGVLLLEFLELYGKNFGYDSVGITVRNDGGYFSKARTGWKNEQKPFLLCIEDPLDISNDISKSSFNILSVRQTLAGSFDILSSALCQRSLEMRRDPTLSALIASGSGSGTHKHFRSADDEARDSLLSDVGGSSNGTAIARDPRSLLGNIIGASKDLEKHRKRIHDIYYSGNLHAKLERPRPSLLDPVPGPSSSSQQPPRKSAAEASKDANASAKTKAKAKDKEERQRRPYTPPREDGEQGHGSRAAPIDVDNQPESDTSGIVSVVSEVKSGGGKASKRKAERRQDSVTPAGEEEDSKYAATAATASTSSKKAKTSRSQASSRASTASFVPENSDEDSAEDMELPTIVESGSGSGKQAPRMHSTPASKVSAAAKRDYWASKSAAPVGDSSSLFYEDYGGDESR